MTSPHFAAFLTAAQRFRCAAAIFFRVAALRVRLGLTDGELEGLTPFIPASNSRACLREAISESIDERRLSMFMTISVIQLHACFDILIVGYFSLLPLHLNRGMATFVAFGTLALLTAGLLVCLMWVERKQSRWKRLEPTLVILGSLLILWAMERYGDVVLHWIRHWMWSNSQLAAICF
jgi:hypothetical protein